MKKLFVALLSLSMLVLCACSVDDERTPRNESLLSPQSQNDPLLPVGMIYTSPSELIALYNADTVNTIHFNLARLIASTELLAGAVNIYLGSPETDYWQLTRLPKVIYNYDNTPKYYEYGLLVNGYLVGTITTFAKKEIAGVIAYLLPLLDYSCDEVDYYVGKYPNRYYGTGGVCMWKNCDVSLSEEDLVTYASTDEEERENMFLMMSSEDVDGILDDCDAEGSDVDLTDDIAERDAYWETIDAFVEDHPEVLDAENQISTSISLTPFSNGVYSNPNAADPITSDAEAIAQLIITLDYTIGYFNQFTIPEYANPYLQYTHWEGWCGPAACSWIYRGKYNSYNGHYLPLYGDGNNYNGNTYFIQTGSGNNGYASYNYGNVNHDANLSYHTALYNYTTRSNDADYGLAACFYNEVVPFTFNGIWRFPLYHGGLNRGFGTATNNAYHVAFTCYPFRYILEDWEPVLIAIDCNHYIVAFGYGVTKDGDGHIKDKYFMITDNGHTTSPSYHPYMRRKNFWNLHYGLTQ